MNKRNQLVLGIDIGGTSVKSAIVDISIAQLVSDTMSIPTPQNASVNDFNEIFQQIKKEFIWDGPVGCGFPGVIKNGEVLSAANISKDWIGTNLKNILNEHFTNNISVINDADAAGIAEMRVGIGQKWNKTNAGVVLIITLGTGIGSALFIDGQLVPNTEFGQIKMDNIVAEHLAATVIKESENLSWENWGKRVNDYLHMMYNLLTPECIIIGGGVSSNPEKFFKYIDLECELLPAKMGNAAGIIGAALNNNLY